jgi:hypothetical protein
MDTGVLGAAVGAIKVVIGVDYKYVLSTMKMWLKLLNLSHRLCYNTVRSLHF